MMFILKIEKEISCFPKASNPFTFNVPIFNNCSLYVREYGRPSLAPIIFGVLFIDYKVEYYYCNLLGVW